jgi:sugar phosphate permease
MEVRENFCGICMAVPIALAGAGVAGLSTKEDYRKRKKIMITTGIVVLVVSLFLWWYYRDCASCKV